MWNCLGKPTALVEVEEIACNGTDERLTVTGKVICSATIPRIDKVIFNDPATIVFWSDGTKTVVKTHDEIGEIIRCKDCKHYDGRPCGLVDWYNTADDFCSRAERREE